MRAAAAAAGGVGVQHGLVALVGDRAQDLTLGVGRIGEQRKRLIGVGGDHDLIEALRLAARAAVIIDVRRPSRSTV